MKPKIKEAIIVEGKYDRIKLSSIVDALIIETNGFQIYKNKKQRQLIKSIAEKTGVIILTDSDRAGFNIRSFISQGISKKNIKQAYVPDVFGKEKRKTAPGKEGKIGVEGIEKDIIINALANAGATIDGISKHENEEKITKLDLYNDGLSGGKHSAILRKMFLSELSLPENTSANMLCEIINLICSRDTYNKIVEKIHKNIS